MNTKLSLLNIMLIAMILLSACGPSSTTVTIQIPGLDNQQQEQPPANNPQIILVYILAGALVIIALAALLGKRGTQ